MKGSLPDKAFKEVRTVPASTPFIFAFEFRQTKNHGFACYSGKIGKCLKEFLIQQRTQRCVLCDTLCALLPI